MKKLKLITCCMLILSLCSCGNDDEKLSDAAIGEWKSDIYTEKDVQSAISVTEDYFSKEFSGCTLTHITYAGDDVIPEYNDWAKRNDADEVMVLTSSFDADSSGGDGSLNPNSTYDNWNWILVRSGGEKWVHVDHGY